MDVAQAASLARHPSVVRRRLTVDEYHRMAEVGILGPEERVELVDGEIIVKFPASAPHASVRMVLGRILVPGVGDRALVSIGNPVRLDRYNEPEPDVALLRPKPDDYWSAHPGPQDVLLLIEVADASLDYDRAVKRPLYARHGICEYWIVDIPGRSVEVHHYPENGKYWSVSRVGADGVLVPTWLPDLSISVGQLLR